MAADKKLDVFKEFLKQNTVLIVDTSSASRRRLTKTIVDMGGNRQNVHSVAHYSEALEIVEKEKPKLVMSDFAIKGGSGFDLFREFRVKYPDEKKATLILITSNISQSAVAKAAEEDVDSFIIKPYTVKSLEKSLVTAVYNKLCPSAYIQKIDAGKEALFSGNYPDAEALFNEAKALTKKPSLALFYLGQVRSFQEMMEEANKDFKEGLTFNHIHYKCQLGLYELLMKKNNYKEAYAVVKNISKYFPSNPDRLKEVVRLAMVTQNYEDMEDYYNVFVELEERTEDVVNYVCAGMYICGKYMMQQNDSKRAKEMFEKIGVSCLGISKFLKAMIVLLYEYGYAVDARKLLGRFSSGSSDSADYDISCYLIDSQDMDDSEKMTKGLELYNKGFKDFYAMNILVKAMLANNFADKAKDYQEEIARLWPDRQLPTSLKKAA